MKNYQKLNEKEKLCATDPFTLERYRQFFNHFPDQSRICLDIGCSTGRGGRILKELNQNLNIIGLDCVKSFLDKIEIGIYSQIICSYSTDIPLEDISIDVIFAGEFMEHLYVEDVQQTLQEFYRILKPGGRLLLTTPNPNYIRLKLTGGSVVGGVHLSQHYPTSLKIQLKTIGFANIKIFGSGKISRLLGENFPILSLYGSYLAIADKI